jgi:hypothetical protein
MAETINSLIQKYIGPIEDQVHSFIRPHIPPEKLTGIISRYATYETPAGTIFLYDDTLLRNCRASLIVTESGIHGKSRGKPPFHFNFGEINDIEQRLTALFINQKMVFYFNFADTAKVQSITQFITELNAAVVASGLPPQTHPKYENDPIYAPSKRRKRLKPKSAPPAATLAKPQENQALIDKSLPEVKEQLYNIPNVFVSPHIPKKILETAITSYAAGVNSQDVNILYDSSQQTPGASGFIATNAGLYSKNPNGQSAFYPAKDLKSLKMQKDSSLLVNNSGTLPLYGVTALQAGTVLAYLTGVYHVTGAQSIISLILQSAMSPEGNPTLMEDIVSFSDQVDQMSGLTKDMVSEIRDGGATSESGEAQDDIGDEEVMEDDDLDLDEGDDDDLLSSLFDD